MEKVSGLENDAQSPLVTEGPQHENLQLSVKEITTRSWNNSTARPRPSIAEVSIDHRNCEKQQAAAAAAAASYISSQSSDLEANKTETTSDDSMDFRSEIKAAIISNLSKLSSSSSDQVRIDQEPRTTSTESHRVHHKSTKQAQDTRTTRPASFFPLLTNHMRPMRNVRQKRSNNGPSFIQDTTKRCVKRSYKQQNGNYSPHNQSPNKNLSLTVGGRRQTPKLKKRRQANKGDRSESSSDSSTESGYLGSSSSNAYGHQQSSCASPLSQSDEVFSERTDDSDVQIEQGTDDTSSLESILGVHESDLAQESLRSKARSCRLFASSAQEQTTSLEGTSLSNAPNDYPEFISQRMSSRNNYIVSESKDNRRPPRTQASRAQALNTKMIRATRRKVQNRHHTLLQDNFKSALLFNAKNNLYKRAGAQSGNSSMLNGRPAILNLSSDLMAHCMTFLDPPEVHSLLTMPMSRDWRTCFTMPQDLWKILCLTEPLKAKFEDIEDENSTEDDDSTATPNMTPDLDIKHLLGRYRILYTSFVRCMKYLEKIKEDARNGRPPSVIDYGTSDNLVNSVRPNESLKTFLARARRIVVDKKLATKANATKPVQYAKATVRSGPIGVTDNNASVEGGTKSVANTPTPPKATVKYGQSQITKRLLGPAKNGKAGNVNLPWSCAIYSIVNWMVAFADVEGVQTMCLKALPDLLEDESQRTTAQLAGLTDIVLKGMVLFPDSVTLHTAAFHTIVLLARPLGGKEGMLFHCSMVNSSGIFNKRSRSGKNGIAVMLDSMKRYEKDEVLQAMSCWSLVNIALAPSQKAVLVKLGGISMVANAMVQHPYNTEVQFRALFALINLVIPSVSPHGDNEGERISLQESLGDVNNSSEKDMLDDSVGQITNLVVVAMKNFCSSESILNRACLVLHNLSLTEEYHTTLLWTPNCYQMLEWCLANHRADQVLQQSAAGTLQRLQNTLSNDEGLRQRFSSSLQSQQRSSVEQTRRESRAFVEQEEQVELSPPNDV